MKKWLTNSGLIAAIGLAVTIVLCLGFDFLVYPILFLVFGSLLSRVNKGALEHDDSNGRTAWQVLSNGGVGFTLAILYYFTNQHTLAAAFIVTFSCATSDTFSSEIGRYYKGKTIDILTMNKIRPGLSGGISIIGTLGGVLGSMLIAFMAYVIGHLNLNMMFLIFVFGFLGMIIDSLIGSGLQAKYIIKGQLLENGERTQLTKGLYWMDNNLVNFMSILITTLLFLSFL